MKNLGSRPVSMPWNQQEHGYEQLREVVVDILTGEQQVGSHPTRYSHLIDSVAKVMALRTGHNEGTDTHRYARLHLSDTELVRDIFWDLFRQGSSHSA
jgi:hypothetical protein